MTVRRVLGRIGAVLFFVVIAALIGFVLWAESPMRAEAGPLRAAETDPAFTYTETGTGVTLLPNEPNGTGLVFIAGARVEAPAYANTLSGLAEAGVTVVIVRPILNFAILEYRSLAAFETPGVDQWFVGGHSLGGVKACQYAADPTYDIAGLILFGSYCASDISGTDLPVLTLSAENDGLSTPAKIADAAGLLPDDSVLVSLPGAVHAQFGDYGAQPGDGRPVSEDAAVKDQITTAIMKFMGAKL